MNYVNITSNINKSHISQLLNINYNNSKLKDFNIHSKKIRSLIVAIESNTYTDDQASHLNSKLHYLLKLAKLKVVIDKIIIEKSKFNNLINYS